VILLPDRDDPQSEKMPYAIPGDNRHVGSTSLTGRVCEACPNLLRVSDAGPSRRFGLHRGRRPKASNEDAMGRASTRILHPSTLM
jgi:hypothetical protein